ncbi:MAG: helicase C-terminal domain-containing protein [Candidatus Pacearchaeota archaeon]
MWSLNNNEKELNPLIFSNGKSQADIVKEVYDSVGEGYRIIFIKGVCGSGKSAIALNLARKFGRASIVVPIKSLQEQYAKDYTENLYVLDKNKKEKLKIASIVGRNNFNCRFLETRDNFRFKEEKNLKLNEIFEKRAVINSEGNKSCDNPILPCKIEIKEKNLNRIKDYIKENPDINLIDFDSIKDVKRMSVASVCPYWCPILSDVYDVKKFKEARKIKYRGLGGKEFTIYQRKKGCEFYDQYEAYADADVIIFNSLKYRLESIMDRKPATDIEIIDECDEFLDNFANQKQISLSRLNFAINSIFVEEKYQKALNELIDITNTLKLKYSEPNSEITELKGSLVYDLLAKVLESQELINSLYDDSNYLTHLLETARSFDEDFNETFFSVEKGDKDILIKLVTTNLAKRVEELIEKNKIIIMMSGTIHSEGVLKNIFGLDKFKVIEAEIQNQGELIKCKHGYEMDCSYANFQRGNINREKYLKALEKSVSCAKKPTLVHVNSFSDLPNEIERNKFELDNLMTQEELLREQSEDPFSERVNDFKKGKTKILFTTKCSRGIDFPGEMCNSIVITRFPYPNISSLFWKILKRTKPGYFMSFYMDKARRELLQRIYRGLRSKEDRVYLLSPDKRVLDFKLD